MYGAVFADKLFEMWPGMKRFPFTEKDIRIDLNKHTICSKDDNIHDFFTYIKLISTHRVNFDNAVKSFVIYSDVSIRFRRMVFKKPEYFSNLHFRTHSMIQPN